MTFCRNGIGGRNAEARRSSKWQSSAGERVPPRAQRQPWVTAPERATRLTARDPNSRVTESDVFLRGVAAGAHHIRTMGAILMQRDSDRGSLPP